jgi:hypothetical protein
MSIGQSRDEYYQARLGLMDLISCRNRLLRSLGRMIREAIDGPLVAGIRGEFDMARAQDLLRRVGELESQIAAATDLVNQYARQIGAPPIAGQGTHTASAHESDDK